MFYKIKALSELHADIYLHVFDYGRGRQTELQNYCKKVFYYDRNSFLKSTFSKIPFAVKSRANKKLIENLDSDDAPILFEGLHTTFPLLVHSFTKKIFIRAHNIEHLYFAGLSKSEKRFDRKLFYKMEARKFRSYEKIFDKAQHVFTISPYEHDYFKKKFGDKAIYTPVFHQNAAVKSLSKKGDYALYHGDLRISDNVKSVEFLIDLFKDLDYKLMIASSYSNKSVIRKIEMLGHINYIKIEDNENLQKLLHNAHINVLPTFQKTGIKLKLINTLFQGRHLIVTPEMVEDTGLESLCKIASTKEEFKKQVLILSSLDYSSDQMVEREEKLKAFDVIESAKIIIDLL